MTDGFNAFGSAEEAERARLNYDRKYKDLEPGYSVDYIRSWVRRYTSLMDYAGGTLLDAGCGIGDWSVGFAKEFDVTGVDISGVAIERARARSKNINFIKGDVFDLSGSYDVIFCRGLSVFNRPPTDSIFREALSNLLNLTTKLFVYCVWTEEPYGERYREGDGLDGWYKQDPKAITRLFESYGDARVCIADNYLVGEIRW